MIKLLITQAKFEHHLSVLLQLHPNSRINIWLEWIGQRQLQDKMRKNWSVGIWCALYYIRCLTVFVDNHPLHSVFEYVVVSNHRSITVMIFQCRWHNYWNYYCIKEALDNCIIFVNVQLKTCLSYREISKTLLQYRINKFTNAIQA